MGEKLKRKYALTDKGLRNTRVGAAWTVVVNLTMMAGMGILYLLMQKYMNTLTDGAALPKAWIFVGLVAVFIVLSFLTHLQQYHNTYGLVYREIKDTRITLAERLRRLPLGYFGKRDLADLTETIMGDVNRLEHVWSHCLGYLYGAYISTAIIAVVLFLYDWRMAIACLWGVPVAFILLFGSRRIQKRASETLKAHALAVSDGIQESLENVREIRATNREKEFLDRLNQKIDRAFRQRRFRHHAAGRGDDDPHRRVSDPLRKDRFYAAVHVLNGHHTGLCAVRSGAGADCGDVCFAGLSEPFE